MRNSRTSLASAALRLCIVSGDRVQPLGIINLSALAAALGLQQMAIPQVLGESNQAQSAGMTEMSKKEAPSDFLKDLPVKAYLDKSKKVAFYSIETKNNSKATFIIAPLNEPGVEIKPAINLANRPTSETAKKEQAIAAVNAGYFNLKDGLSASYITINGQQVCDPHENAALMNNPKLKPFMPQILNRSELRFLNDKKGRLAVGIQTHNTPPPSGFSIKHAIQAGPQLLPRITAEEEAFLRKEPDGTTTDSIGCLKTAARTAFGVTADKKAVILCVSGPKQDEFSSGVSLQDLAELMSKLGCVAAINFDGGTSSTMAIRSDLIAGSDADESRKQSAYTLVCGKHPETQVKSCLVIR